MYNPGDEKYCETEKNETIKGDEMKMKRPIFKFDYTTLHEPFDIKFMMDRSEKLFYVRRSHYSWKDTWYYMYYTFAFINGVFRVFRFNSKQILKELQGSSTADTMKYYQMHTGQGLRVQVSAINANGRDWLSYDVKTRTNKKEFVIIRNLASYDGYDSLDNIADWDIRHQVEETMRLVEGKNHDMTFPQYSPIPIPKPKTEIKITTKSNPVLAIGIEMLEDGKTGFFQEEANILISDERNYLDMMCRLRDELDYRIEIRRFAIVKNGENITIKDPRK